MKEPADQALRDAWRAGQAACPGLSVALERFAAWVATRDLELARAADHYLACGCAAGDAAALAAFDRTHLAEARRSLARLGLGDSGTDEIVQELRLALFVEGEINAYAGRGALEGWTRTIAVRAGLKALRRDRRELPLDDDALAALPTDDDPALHRLKETYAPQFRAALRDALDALTVRQRNLIRQHVCDGLSIDRLATLYQVHRATAARWLVDARAELLELTQGLLMARLGLASGELASLLRVVRSQLDATLPGALRE